VNSNAPITRVLSHSVVGAASAISVLLILSFSTRPPWTQPPTARTAVHEQPTAHVQPQDRAVGFVDRIVASQGVPSSDKRSLEAGGWAVSCVPAVSLTSVILLVDGKPAGEAKGFSSRPDVAAPISSRLDGISAPLWGHSAQVITLSLSGLSLRTASPLTFPAHN
jgi:hypothetical protein